MEDSVFRLYFLSAFIEQDILFSAFLSLFRSYFRLTNGIN